MDWDDFRVFTTVARVGSYTRAARELSLTQPAVSRRIARLEAAIGAKLFDRNTRGAELTSEGERVLNHASAAEFSLSRAVSLARDATTNVEGTCKLGIGDGLGAGWMPRFMPSFLAMNPNIELKLFITHDRGASKKPLFDLHIQYQEPMEPNNIAVRLGDLHFILFASPEYISVHGTPSSPEDLAHHRILDLSLALTEKGTLAFWAGLSNKAALFTNSSIALGECVRAGAGISLLPTYAASVDPRLTPILPQLHFQSPVFVCYERDAGSKPAVRKTINFLKDAVFNRQELPWFSEAFHLPTAQWHDMLKAHIARLTKDVAGRRPPRSRA